MSYLPLSIWKNPHGLIMGDVVTTVVLSIMNRSSSFILAYNKDNY